MRINFKPARGFTMVELLVMTAIILILASLLLLSLSRAKASAHSVTCKSNLHQMGIALQTYLSANHSYPVNGLNNTRPPSRADSERFWTGQLVREGFGVKQPGTNFHETGVWRCPSVEWSDAMLRGNSEMINYGYNDDKFAGNSLRSGGDMYGLQGVYNQEANSWRPIGESAVISPTGMMAIADGFEGNGMFRRRPIDELVEWGNTRSRHQRKANVLFCDGHIETIKLTLLFEDTSDASLVRWHRDNQPHRERW